MGYGRVGQEFWDKISQAFHSLTGNTLKCKKKEKKEKKWTKQKSFTVNNKIPNFLHNFSLDILCS